MTVALIAFAMLAASGWTMALAERARRLVAERIAGIPSSRDEAVVTLAAPAAEEVALRATKDEAVSQAAAHFANVAGVSLKEAELEVRKLLGVAEGDPV